MVYHVVSHWDNKEYVMKKISLKHLNEKKQKEALKEVSVMKSLSSPHIIQYASVPPVITLPGTFPASSRTTRCTL